MNAFLGYPLTRGPSPLRGRGETSFGLVPLSPLGERGWPAVPMQFIGRRAG
jgi:hypothetical protein